MKTLIARKLRMLADLAMCLADRIDDVPDDSPAAFAVCRVAITADDAEAELQRLAAVISGASVAPKPARHEARGQR
jgi:hypothetical protein